MRDIREVKAAAVGAATVAIYMALVLGSGLVNPAQFGALLGFYVKASFSVWFIFGIGWLLLQLYHNRPKDGPGPNPIAVLRSAILEAWERDRFVSMVWPPLLFATLMASFNAFKQMILPGAAFTLDPAFAYADRMLFVGVDPWRITHALIGPTGTLLIDRAYHGWFLPMSIGVILCAWMPASTYRLRTQYLLSYIAVWIGIGSFLAYLLPAAGPCFYDHFVGSGADFGPLIQNLHAAQAATGSHLTAISNQEGLLRLFGSDALAVGGGISAMPSVHNGLAVLFALAGFQINRKAGWAFTAYAVLIWIGSIHLGWHYAIDGIFAAALTVVIWRVAGRVADRLSQPSRPAEPQPAFI